MQFNMIKCVLYIPNCIFCVDFHFQFGIKYNWFGEKINLVGKKTVKLASY